MQEFLASEARMVRELEARTAREVVLREEVLKRRRVEEERAKCVTGRRGLSSAVWVWIRTCCVQIFGRVASPSMRHAVFNV